MDIYCLLFFTINILFILGSNGCSCETTLETVRDEDTQTMITGQTLHFCVCGRYPWSDSAIKVIANDIYLITVNGVQTWTDYNHITTADGYANKWIKFCLCVCVCMCNQYC